MPDILDRYGKPIRKAALSRIYNAGPMLLTSGFLYYGGTYLNPDKIGIKTYEEMLRTDETCRAGIEFVTLAAISRLGEYSHPKKKINDFINNQFERVKGSIYWIVEEMLSSLWAGFSTGEMIFDYEDGKVQIADVQYLHPLTISFELHTDGIDKNHIKGVKQNAFGFVSNPDEVIPIDKLLIYTHNGRFGNPYGESRFRSIYSDYYFKKQMIVAWAKTLEKYGSPTAVGKVKDPDSTMTDPKGEQITQLEYMTRILDSLQVSTAVAISDDSEIEFNQVSRALGQDFENAVNYCNKMIYRGLLLPGLLETGEQGGSRALGSVHFDLFVLALEKIKNDVTEVLIDQMIRRLITWNFGEQDDWGEFQTDEFKPEDAKLFAEILSQMTTAGYVSPQYFEDLEFVREKIGLPGMPREEWQRLQDEKKKEQEAIAGGIAGTNTQKSDNNGKKESKGTDNPEKPAKNGSKAQKYKEIDDIEEFRGSLNGLLSSFMEE